MAGHRWWVLLFVAAALLGPLERARGEEFVPLFNGKDLDGWVEESHPNSSKHDDGRPVWSVKDGMIQCDGKGFGFLRYDRAQYRDFTFHVEFRMAPKCNSGLGVRTRVFDPSQSRNTRPSLYSYEIQLFDDGDQPPSLHSSGSLYRYVAPRTSAMKPAGEWNTVEITCVGPRIKVVFNERTVIDVDQSTIKAIENKPLEGYVCLQNHGGKIAFRNVSIKTLDAPAAPAPSQLDQAAFKQTPAVIGDPEAQTQLTRSWSGGLCKSTLTNTSRRPIKVKDVLLFRVPHGLSPESRVYGEGFQMLSQTGGTLGKPVDLGDYTDLKHYRMPQAKDATVAYGVVTLTPPERETLLLGFTSCRRFVGRFELRPNAIDVILDTENRELGPGQSWDLEEFMVATGNDRAALLDRLASQLAQNHPPRKFPAPPTGWCSWYCFGPRVTAAQVLGNLDTIGRTLPALRYIQLDDGYQRAMGDWLEVGDAFGGGIRDVLAQIKAKGYEPAIWVAPFIAEKESHLFQQHPDWFVKDAKGAPLESSKVTFGGWRHGPWYALDGTHPEVQAHLENLFRTLREQWGCTYFKLDANFWGAIHGGRFHDKNATRVEAYRRGMEAVIRGAGDAFILGCNHPLWPSLGVIDGSRSSGDISRNWKTFAKTAGENLSRNWQNGQLWWNDPDCLVLTGKLSEDEFRFHATAIYASGGLILAGDDLTRLPDDRLATLRKLLPPTGVAARFDDETLGVGRIPLEKGREALCVFNWDDTPSPRAITLRQRVRVRDFWTGEDLGQKQDELQLPPLPPHSARLLTLEPE